MYYTYDEALNRIEEFMMKSGLRYFCTKVCKGACCSGCYESDKACHKNEGRRLSCSIFLCLQLVSIAFSSEERNEFLEVKGHCLDVIDRNLTKGSQYFDVHTKTLQNKCKFNSAVIDKLEQINTSKVKYKVMSMRALLNRMAERALWKKRKNEA